MLSAKDVAFDPGQGLFEDIEQIVDLCVCDDQRRREHRHVDQWPHNQTQIFAGIIDHLPQPTFGFEVFGLALDTAQQAHAPGVADDFVLAQRGQTLLEVR